MVKIYKLKQFQNSICSTDKFFAEPKADNFDFIVVHLKQELFTPDFWAKKKRGTNGKLGNRRRNQ